MTLEELKVEADKLGYRVVKKKIQHVNLLPCLCGCKRRKHEYVDGKIRLVCSKCRQTSSGYSLADASRNWNRMVRSGVIHDTSTS